MSLISAVIGKYLCRLEDAREFSMLHLWRFPCNLRGTVVRDGELTKLAGDLSLPTVVARFAFTDSRAIKKPCPTQQTIRLYGRNAGVRQGLNVLCKRDAEQEALSVSTARLKKNLLRCCLRVAFSLSFPTSLFRVFKSIFCKRLLRAGTRPSHSKQGHSNTK
jgi:hypothetical protein